MTTAKSQDFASESQKELIQFGTKYEVKCEETFAYFDGYVVDYNEEEHALDILYDWKAGKRVTLENLRPVAAKTDDNWKPKVGENIECQAKGEATEPFGWWGCKIVTIRDNLYMISYDGWDNHFEVLQKEMIRPRNNARIFYSDPSQSTSNVVRYVKPLSHSRICELLRTSADTNGELHEYRRIMEKTKLIHMGYRPDLRVLLLIGTATQVETGSSLLTEWLQTNNNTKNNTRNRNNNSNNNNNNSNENPTASEIKLSPKAKAFKSYFFSEAAFADKYYDAFVAHGYNDLGILMGLAERKESHLVTNKCGMSAAHAKRLFTKLDELNEKYGIFYRLFASLGEYGIYETVSNQGIYSYAHFEKRFATVEEFVNVVGEALRPRAQLIWDEFQNGEEHMRFDNMISNDN